MSWAEKIIRKVNTMKEKIIQFMKGLNTVQKTAIVLIFILFLVYLACSLKQYTSFNSIHPRDFAQEANPVSLTLFYGKFMGSHLDGQPLFLQTHVSIVPFLMLPFLALFRCGEIFIILATLLIFIGAYFIYRIALFLLKSDWLALFSSLLYCIYVPIQYNVLNDWRYNFFYIPVVIAAFYYYIKRREKLFLLFFVLTILTRDEGIFIVLMYPVLELFNAYLLKKKKELALFDDRLKVKNYILIPLAVILVYFVLFSFLLKKYFIHLTGFDQIRMFLFEKFGKTPFEVAFYFLTHFFSIIKEYILDIRKIGFFVNELFLPLLFLPFIGFQAFILALPSLFLYLLFEYPSGMSISSPYSVTTAGVRYLTFFLSYFIIATIMAIRNLRVWIKDEKYFRFAAFGLFSVILLINLRNSPMPLPFTGKYESRRFTLTDRDKAIKKMIGIIKRNDTVTTQFDYLAYFLDRKFLADVNHVMQFNYELIPLGRYVFVDLKKRWFFNVDNFFFTMWRVRESGEPYTLIDLYDAAFLLSRDTSRKNPGLNITADALWQYIFSQQFPVRFYDKYAYVRKEEKPSGSSLLVNFKDHLRVFSPIVSKENDAFLVQVPVLAGKNAVFRLKDYMNYREDELSDNIDLVLSFQSPVHSFQLDVQPVCPVRFWEREKIYWNDIKLDRAGLMKTTYQVFLDIVMKRDGEKEVRLTPRSLLIGQLSN
ncbi:MAG: DUF2079 domain-containing protein [bacterium]|nr:DUF2079 domain-containing protein [bacterium]